MRVIQKILVILVFISMVSVAMGISVRSNPIITFNENGNGTFMDGSTLHWTIAPDPGPGGLPNTLTYLPLFGSDFPGDLLIMEPTGELSDVVRFNIGETSPAGTIVFYSEVPEDAAEKPDLADVGLPMEFYPNTVVMTEKGTEGNNWVDYTPLQGQPGYLPNYPGTTYHIISDIPEPSTFALLGAGIISLLAFAWRRR
jgi:hypothetical protein